MDSRGRFATLVLKDNTYALQIGLNVCSMRWAVFSFDWFEASIEAPLILLDLSL